MRFGFPWRMIWRERAEVEATQNRPDTAGRLISQQIGAGGEMEGLLDDLESKLFAGTSLPMTPLVIVNRRPILRIIDGLRTSLPREIEEARHIIQDEERILSAARREATQITAEAERKAEEILEENQLQQMAANRAQEIVSAAQRHAEEILRTAQTQAWGVLQTLERAQELLGRELGRGGADPFGQRTQGPHSR